MTKTIWDLVGVQKSSRAEIKLEPKVFLLLSQRGKKEVIVKVRKELPWSFCVQSQESRDISIWNLTLTLDSFPLELGLDFLETFQKKGKNKLVHVRFGCRCGRKEETDSGSAFFFITGWLDRQLRLPVNELKFYFRCFNFWKYIGSDSRVPKSWR